MKYYQSWQAGRYDFANTNEYPLFPAEVPGNVQYDYARHLGLDLGSLMYSTNTDKLLETEKWYWQYQTRLQFTPTDKTFLVFEGIDYAFDILLNSSKIYSGEGMYAKVELDVTNVAKAGDLLQVIIHPHPARQISDNEPYRSAADRSCKPPVTYGWDWNPRLINSGLWRNAYIESRGDDYIYECEPFYTLSDDLSSASVEFKTTCSAQVEYTVFDPDGNIVYNGHKPNCTINNIKLWWCNGHGEPNLYRYTAQTKTHKIEDYIGFKSFKLTQNPGTNNEPHVFPKGRYAARITPTLNGRNIFAKGSNWVNPELFFGCITVERLEEQIVAAKNANMNIFRIWGGAGILRDEFYELCDKHGIMVWQEFMLACNCYEDGENYLAVLEKEATAIIKALRKHPSIVLWCGGNELFNGWSGMDEQSHALRLLNSLCYQLDKNRPFLPTSPLSGMAHGGYTFIDPDTNKDCFYSHQHAHHTAYIEFGNPSISPVENLKKIIPENELFPIEPTESWVHHHGFYAWGNERWLCLPVIERYCGKAESLSDLVAQSQWLQSEGYKAIFEEARRQSPYCSMAINWCFQEPWITAANNSLLAYPSVKKPAYYAVKNSLRPILASAKIPKFDWTSGETFSAEVWLLNDTVEKTNVKITATLTLGGDVLATLCWNTGLCGGNKIGPALNAVLPDAEHLSELKLTLDCENSEYSSEYTLCYKNPAKATQIKQLNM